MKFLERALDGQNQFWKYVIVFLGGFLGGQIVGAIPLGIVIVLKTMAGGVINPENVMDFTALGLSKNLGLFLMLLPTVVSLIFTILLIKSLHRRTFAETVNGRKKIRFNRFFMGVLVWGILMAIYLIGDYWANPQNYVLQFDWKAFIPLLLISVLFIPLQTTSEELLFRGYLAQGIAGWTKNRWLAVLIPGLLFGLLHISNPEVKEFGFWLAMPQYVFFGLLFGLIAVLDDGIELPMGMHAINNVFLSLFTTHSASALQTDAVFEIKSLDPAKDLVSLIIIGIACFAYFSVKYKWDIRVLNKKVTND
ncbi:abortive infection protein [Bacteroidia bacterium]|nr:abortive infection protein [Bacteroidia bacterium]